MRFEVAALQEFIHNWQLIRRHLIRCNRKDRHLAEDESCKGGTYAVRWYRYDIHGPRRQAASISPWSQHNIFANSYIPLVSHLSKYYVIDTPKSTS